MTAINRAIIFVAGAGLVACGLAILASGGLTLPPKTPPLQFQFSGFSLLLLAGSPLSLGSMSLAISRGSLDSRSSTALVLFGLSMALAGSAFLVAPKV